MTVVLEVPLVRCPPPPPPYIRALPPLYYILNTYLDEHGPLARDPDAVQVQLGVLPQCIDVMLGIYQVVPGPVIVQHQLVELVLIIVYMLGN